MFKNYLKTSFRNLLRHKSYTFINVLGLTVGLVTSIFILLWIVDELSYDRFHSNTDQIFKVMVNNTYPDGKIETYGATPAKLKDVIVQEIPEVELAAQYSMETELLVKREINAFNEIGIYADPTLFKILSFPIIRGSETQPLTDIKSIAILKDSQKNYLQTKTPLENR
jgi:putative ABC transport system permease protein